MEWLDFEFESNYSKNQIIIHLRHNVQPDGHKWAKRTILLTKTVTVSSFFSPPSKLLDRTLLMQIKMLKWYEKNKKLLDAVEMMFVNGREFRIQIEDLKKKEFFDKIIRY